MSKKNNHRNIQIKLLFPWTKERNAKNYYWAHSKKISSLSSLDGDSLGFWTTPLVVWIFLQMVQFYTRKYYFEFSSFRKTVKPNRDTGCWTSTAKKNKPKHFFLIFIFAVGMGGFERKLRTILFWKMSETFLKKGSENCRQNFFFLI